jgi:peroxiredoxin
MKNFIITCFLFAFGVTAFANTAISDSLVVGQFVPGFTLKNMVPNQPKTVSLTNYHQKKGVIIIFMTNGCYHCILYRERIKALHQEYEAKGYPVITINPSNPSYAFEETEKELIKNAIKEQYQFPYLQDSTQETTMKYGVTYTPEAFVLQRDGTKWILKYKGDIDNDLNNKKKNKTSYVDLVVNALINKKEVPIFPKSKD